MLRKVKKYLKFVVCCALILSLIAPSYAALSASDGSAFVTKAEFDSALADFNARLTTFEAGINSKIDSQVTSYLDRNGIWNGAECEFIQQPLTEGCYRQNTSALTFATGINKGVNYKVTRTKIGNTYQLTFNYKKTDTSAWTTFSNPFGGSGGSGWIRLTPNQYCVSTPIVKYKCNKSGLCCAATIFIGAASEFAHEWEIKTNSNNATYALECGFMWVKSDFVNAGEIVRTDESYATTKDVIVANYPDQTDIQAVFNTVIDVWNFFPAIRQTTTDYVYRFVNPNRSYAYQAIVDFQAQDKDVALDHFNGIDIANELGHGMLIPGGSFSNYFFVSKNDYVWLSGFKYIVQSNQNYIDMKWGSGNSLKLNECNVVVY